MEDEYSAYQETLYTAEISNRMRVPDRLSLIDDPPSTNGFDGVKKEHAADFHRMMTVPDRILVAGGNSHISAKGPPRELQLENSVLPPQIDQIRVGTPPQSIRLDEHFFPSVDPSGEEHETTNHYHPHHQNFDGGFGSERPRLDNRFRSGSVESESQMNSSFALLSRTEGTPRDSLSPWEELQLVRRQIAKLNHRLMAVELENQHQQQRETILTVILSAYFIGKFIMWIHRSL